MPKKLRCKFLQQDKDKCLQCAFTEREPGKSPNSCNNFIEVPTINTLLSEKEKAEHNSYLEEIKNKVKEKQATLVLGAGISKPAGLPGWFELISQLFGYAMQISRYTSDSPIDSSQQAHQIALESDLINGKLTIFESGNVLEAGQYITQMLESSLGNKRGEEMLKETISFIIHKGHRAFDLDGAKRSSIDRLKRSQAKKDSLRAVAYLLQTKNGFRRAITYNYDTLVEDCLIDLFKIESNQVISHPGEWNTIMQEEISDPINIYHVHGCLPRREYQNDPKFLGLKESKRIILSEDSYYRAEQHESYNWMNSIQSYYLNRDTCVFVGFSADDYNFRRILRQLGMDNQSQKGTPKHYLILTIDDLVKELWHNVCRNNLGVKNIKSKEIYTQVILLLQKQLEIKREYWKRYNFFPIWVTVKDIPKTLLSVV